MKIFSEHIHSIWHWILSSILLHKIFVKSISTLMETPKNSTICLCAHNVNLYARLSSVTDLHLILSRNSTEVAVRRSSLKKAFKILHFYWKIPVLRSFFDKVANLKACNFIKKRLQHRCFPVNIAKCLRTTFIEHIWWLLLIIRIQRRSQERPEISKMESFVTTVDG